MIRSSLAALLLLTLPALHAETKKTAAVDKPAKAEKTTPAAAADMKEPAKKEAAKAAEKPATKPAKPAAKPATKPAAGAVDPADQALLDHADKELKKLSPAQNASLLKLANEGKPEELLTIPGIGETKAAAVKKARPLKSSADLIMVDGIGEVTFDGIVKWVKDGMPKDEPAAKPAAKPKAKAEEKPAPKPATKAEAKTVPAKK